MAELHDKLGDAQAWCSFNDATSVAAILDADFTEQFVKGLHLKPLPESRLRKRLKEWAAAPQQQPASEARML